MAPGLLGNCWPWRDGTSEMKTEFMYPNRLGTALSVWCLLCALYGCSYPAEDARPEGSVEIHWYVREVVKGEIVPEEGPHQQFETFGEPIPIRVEEEQFRLTFSLRDDRTRDVTFLVRREGPSAYEVSCPSTNLEPKSDALPRQDRRLNEAISEHSPVSVVRDEWTTFFNDRLRGVFSSDWQLWWGEQEQG